MYVEGIVQLCFMKHSLYLYRFLYEKGDSKIL